MASPEPATADHVPAVHEQGQCAVADPHGGAAAGGPSPPPAAVSPLTTAATPSTRHADPVSAAEEQPARAAQQPAVQDAPAAGGTASWVSAEQQARPIDAWKRSHMLLIVAALVFSVVGLGLSGHAATRGAFDLSGEEAILAIPLPVYVLTLVFAIADMAVRAARKFRKALHPAVHVGVWLICWIIYAGLIAAFAILAHFTSNNDDEDDDGYDADDARQFVAQFVFIALLFLTTFVLFIVACIDTQAYNLAKTTPAATDASGNPLDPNHHEDRSWRMTKLVFNVLILVFGIIGLAIGLSMVRFNETYSASNIIFPACACALIIPMVWAVADLCFALTGPRRQFLQGVHPGAHVGMWLVSWIILAIIGGILTTSTVINLAQCRNSADGDYRRSVAVEAYALRDIPIVDAAVVPNRVRQVGVATSTTSLATPTASPNGKLSTLGPTSTRILGSLPTTTSSDPYDPYDPYGDDPESDSYYPYRTSSRSSSSSSRPTNSPYGSNPYNDYPSNRNPSSHYSSPYDDGLADFCSQKGIGGPMIATCVFIWIVFVFAFVLFVAGCSDTYLRNHLRNPFTVVYVPVGQPVQYPYPPQPMYSNVPMQGSGKPPMMQGPVMQQPQSQPQQQQSQPQQQQQNQPAQGNVVEYYGSAQ
ncbi:hypothetical protein A9K55_001286 [Cordyceps militaris]|uniref:Uncharacterized protein n=1 Tax=Cordyceps militaris TaxID=73501 RepID=A0A2H4SRI6_CORMI|nr:hypothetical protein A9K55_001286 [Cordyceps militaris]